VKGQVKEDMARHVFIKDDQDDAEVVDVREFTDEYRSYQQEQQDLSLEETA